MKRNERRNVAGHVEHKRSTNIEMSNEKKRWTTVVGVF